MHRGGAETRRKRSNSQDLRTLRKLLKPGTKACVKGASLLFVRSFFIFLSRRKLLRKWMETSSLAQRLAARFVAGHDLDQALAVCRELNSAGITVTLDHLGESVRSLEEAAAARDVCLRTLNAIHDSGIQGNVSVKLTQFGLDFSAEVCRANAGQLVEQAEIGRASCRERV